MTSTIIAADPDSKSYSLGELLQRAAASERASWIDLPAAPGVYIVQWRLSEPPRFQANTAAIHCPTVDPAFLSAKWRRINQRAPTDIIYIGKADNLRARVKSLVRFGAGKARNHHGGEWMWQISQTQTAGLLIQECPPGQQAAFENWLLDRFVADHVDLPLANRTGPRGSESWCPSPVFD